jgi:hypothetical protein
MDTGRGTNSIAVARELLPRKQRTSISLNFSRSIISINSSSAYAATATTATGILLQFHPCTCTCTQLPAKPETRTVQRIHSLTGPLEKLIQQQIHQQLPKESCCDQPY